MARAARTPTRATAESSCTACGGGATCSNGTCTCTVSGQQNCDGTCIDTSSNTSNCGSCGNPCGSGQSCSNGTCVGGGNTGGTTGSGGAGTGGATGSGGSGTGGATGTGGTGGATGTGGTGGAPGTGGTRHANEPVVVTSATSAYWKTSGTLTTVHRDCHGDRQRQPHGKQTWEGFGGAFNEMGWNYLQMLSAERPRKAMDLLFGSDAAHFVMARIPIGASDYALQRYTEDETASDTSLTSFSITEDTKYLIPYVKAALAVNSSLRFWASPWTPPTWMKTFSGSVNGTSCAKVGSTDFDGGCMNDDRREPDGVRPVLREVGPGVQRAGDQRSRRSPPRTSPTTPRATRRPVGVADLHQVRRPGPLARRSARRGSTQDHARHDVQRRQRRRIRSEVVSAVMGDATAKGLVKVIGLQWAMLDNYRSQTSVVVHASTTSRSGRPSTSAATTRGTPPGPTGTAIPRTEPAPNDQAYGVESWGYIRNAIKAGVTAYNAWNMVLDTNGKGNDTTRQWSQDSLLVVNTSSKTLTLTPAYYVFRHVSQFVQPGAKVVATTGGDAIAFKNTDGSIVTVMYNSGSSATYIVAVGGKKLQFSMPGNGWATVDYVPYRCWQAQDHCSNRATRPGASLRFRRDAAPGRERRRPASRSPSRIVLDNACILRRDPCYGATPLAGP